MQPLPRPSVSPLYSFCPVTYRDKRRSMMAAKIGWILATGAHPKGQVTTIGAEDDFRLVAQWRKR